MRILVCYHKVDFDGILSGYLATKSLVALGHIVDSVGVNYGDPSPAEKLRDGRYQQIVVVDFSWPDMASLSKIVELIWIDHHPVVQAVRKQDFPKSRLDVSRAACALTWEVFCGGSIPLSVLAVEAWDIKSWKYVTESEASCYQYALRLADPGCYSFALWDTLLDPSRWSEHLRTGQSLWRWETRCDEKRAKHFHTVKWEGLTWRLQLGHAVPVELMWSLDPGTYVGLISVMFVDCKWVVSLRRVPGSSLNLGELAKKHGGGGHPGAAGFHRQDFPYDLFQTIVV